MPQSALEPISPPPLELEDNWPLQAHGEAIELPDAAGGEPNCKRPRCFYL